MSFGAAGKTSSKAGKVKVNDPEYVSQLLALLAQATLLETQAFDNDVEMGRALWVGSALLVDRVTTPAWSSSSDHVPECRALPSPV